MPVAAPSRASIALTSDNILRALQAEREHVQKGLIYKVTSAHRNNEAVVIDIVPAAKDGRSSAIDESLEGSHVRWGENFEGRAEVNFVDPDAGRLVLRFVQGDLPEEDSLIRVFERDFLGPLLDRWKLNPWKAAAAKLLVTPSAGVALEQKPAGADYADLRDRQAQALNLALRDRGRLVGPPGTGKTFTVGAIAARLLTRFKNSRVLLVGPTNIAVDTALLAVDDRLARLTPKDGQVRPKMARVGSRFDPKKFVKRPHLFEEAVYEAAIRVSILELEEPAKANIQAYAAWKDRLEAARKELKSDLTSIVSRSRLVAVTTASAFIWYEELLSKGRWDFVICDEASQIGLPTAAMIGAMGRRVLYAGDPNQLAPVVQSKDPVAQDILGRTAFDHCPGAEDLFLNEQSRMVHRISDIVSTVFYGGELKVCSRAQKTKEWRLERSPFYIDGRAKPAVWCEQVLDEAQWSKKYSGFIRYHTAEMVAQIVANFLGSNVDPGDILVLTPFRAQRALVKNLLRRGSSNAVRVSTVHRSQGTESKIVIFDPVDAGGAFLNSPSGRRLINVAVSRAKTHAIVVIGPSDLKNLWINKIQRLAAAGLPRS